MASRCDVARAKTCRACHRSAVPFGRGELRCCPECHGSLWEIEDGDLLRYRCHVGHAFTAAAALEAHDRDGENTLWSLMRSHQERAELCRRMARSARSAASAASLRKRADEYDEDSRLVRELLEAQPPKAAGTDAEEDQGLTAGKRG